MKAIIPDRYVIVTCHGAPTRALRFVILMLKDLTFSALSVVCCSELLKME